MPADSHFLCTIHSTSQYPTAPAMGALELHSPDCTAPAATQPVPRENSEALAADSATLVRQLVSVNQGDIDIPPLQHKWPRQLQDCMFLETIVWVPLSDTYRPLRIPRVMCDSGSLQSSYIPQQYVHSHRDSLSHLLEPVEEYVMLGDGQVQLRISQQIRLTLSCVDPQGHIRWIIDGLFLVLPLPCTAIIGWQHLVRGP